MSSRQPLQNGQHVKYREAAQVYPATVRSDLEDDIYCLDIVRHGRFTSSIPVHRHDVYADEDLPHLIDDLFGVSEDALAEIHSLLTTNACLCDRQPAHSAESDQPPRSQRAREEERMNHG